MFLVWVSFFTNSSYISVGLACGATAVETGKVGSGEREEPKEVVFNDSCGEWGRESARFFVVGASASTVLGSVAECTPLGKLELVEIEVFGFGTLLSSVVEKGVGETCNGMRAGRVFAFADVGLSEKEVSLRKIRDKKLYCCAGIGGVTERTGGVKFAAAWAEVSSAPSLLLRGITTSFSPGFAWS
jgi:hypothetical protein